MAKECLGVRGPELVAELVLRGAACGLAGTAPRGRWIALGRADSDRGSGALALAANEFLVAFGDIAAGDLAGVALAIRVVVPLEAGRARLTVAVAAALRMQREPLGVSPWFSELLGPSRTPGLEDQEAEEQYTGS